MYQEQSYTDARGETFVHELDETASADELIEAIENAIQDADTAYSIKENHDTTPTYADDSEDIDYVTVKAVETGPSYSFPDQLLRWPRTMTFHIEERSDVDRIRVEDASETPALYELLHDSIESDIGHVLDSIDRD